jgi:hypothetical protein
LLGRPYISPEEGYRGVHNESWIRNPVLESENKVENIIKYFIITSGKRYEIILLDIFFIHLSIQP